MGKVGIAPTVGTTCPGGGTFSAIGPNPEDLVGALVAFGVVSSIPRNNKEIERQI